jgi:hypothetical protein
MVADAGNKVSTTSLSQGLNTFGAVAAVTETPLNPVPNMPTNQEIAQRMLGDPAFAEQQYALRDNNNEAIGAQVMADFENESFGGLVQKYGEEVAYGAFKGNEARQNVAKKLEVDRGLYDTAADLSVDVVNGTVGIAGSILGAGLSLEGMALEAMGSEDNYLSKWGNAVIEGVNDFSELANKSKSQEDQDRQEILGIQRQGDAADNARETKEWAKSNPTVGEFTAGLHRFGLDIMDSGGLLLENPTEFASVAAQGLGSLGPSAKIAGTVAKAAAPFLVTKTERALINQLGGMSAKETMANTLARVAVPASIAGTEAAGVHSQTVTAVMDMTTEELVANSPDYNELIEQGMEPDAAKSRVANMTGIKAAAIQLPVAMLAGFAVKNFEANPLAKAGRAEIIGNLFRETAEEAYQGGTGQMATNYAISTGADTTQDIMEGVGENTAQGAAGGIGMVAGTQGPQLLATGAINTAVEGVKAVNDLGDGIGNTIAKGVNGARDFAKKEIEAVKETNRANMDASNPSGKKATLETIDGTVAATAATITALEASETPEDLDTAALIKDQSFVNLDILDQQSGTMQDLILDITDETGAPVEAVHRMQVFNKVLQKLEDKATTEDQKVDMYVYLRNELDRFASVTQTVNNANLPENENSEMVRELLGTMDSALTVIASNPSIVNSIKSLAQIDDSAAPAPEVTPSSVARVDAVADVNPGGVNPEFARVVLDQEDDGDATYNEPRKKKLKTAANFSENASKAAQDRVDIEEERIESQNQGREEETKLKNGKNFKDVRQEIIAKDYKLRLSNGTSITLPSLSKHLINITNAVNKGTSVDQNGEDRTAPEQLQILGNFVQHQINKLNAYNESAGISSSDRSKDNKQFYQTVNIFKPLEMNEDKELYGEAYSQPTNPNHVSTARLVESDTNLAIDLYNDVVETYPELGGTKIEKVALAPVFGKRTKSDEAAPEAVVVPPKPKTPEAPAAPTGKASMKDVLIEAEDARLAEQALETAALEADIAEEAARKAKAEADVIAEEKRIAEMSEATAFEEAAKKPVEAVETVAEPVAPARPVKAGTGLKDAQIEAEDALLNLSEADAMEAAEKAANAPVEAEVEEAVEPVDPATEMNPNLAAVPGKLNRFVSALTRVKDKSKIADLLSPLTDLMAVINKGDDAIKDFMRNPTEYRINRKRTMAFQELMEISAPEIVKNVNERLKTVMFTKGVSMLDALNDLEGQKSKAGASVLDMRRGLALSLVDMKTQKYDKRLVETAVIAAMHYAMTTFDAPFKSRKDIAEIMGLEEGNITQNEVNAFNFGKPSEQIREEMGREIMRFWGVKVDSKQSLSNTQGLAEALGAELFMVMTNDQEILANKRSKDKDGNYNDSGYVEKDSKSGFFTRKKFQIVREIGGKDVTIEMLSISGKTPLVANIKEEVGPAISMFEDMSFEEKSDTKVRIGSKHTALPKTQKNNKYIDITDYEQKTLKALQNIAFMRNSPFLGMMQAIGKQEFEFLLGSKSEDDTLTNKNHLESIVGKNTSLRNGFDGVMDHDARVKEWALENGADANQTPSYYNWYITKVGRHHMEGFGPQSDKIAREAFIATVSKLDMSKPEDQQLFWMTVAQSSGIVKTEYQFRSVSIETVQDKLNKKYGESLEAMVQWYARSRETGRADEQMLPSEIEAMKAEIGQGGSAKLMHSLLAVAKLNYALASQDFTEITEFEHMLSLEADGKTDGPINAMMHYVTGAFTAEQLRLLAKGGWFANVRDKTLNDHYQNRAEGESEDLYDEAAQDLKRELSDLSIKLRQQGNEEVIDRFDAMMRLLSKFGELKFNEDSGEYEIGRGVLKNPLTITVYGSGQDGIASNVTNAMMEMIYESMTNDMQGNQSNISDYFIKLDEDAVFEDEYAEGETKFEDDIRLLFDGKIRITKKGKYWLDDAPVGDLAFSDKVGFTFSGKQFENAKNNIRILLVDPMGNSIDKLMGETSLTTEMLQKATQIQSAVMIKMFNARVAERLEEIRQEEGNANADFLSDAELGAIYRELMPYGAVIGDDFQPIDVGSARKGESEYTLATTMDDKLAGASSIQSPSIAGVRISPSLTISRGDANMMNIYYQMIDYSIRTLPVFDGQEAAADEMDKVSQDMNQASFEGWQINAIRPVSNSFNAFMRLDPLAEFSDDVVHEIFKLVSPYEDTLDARTTLGIMMKSVHKNLNTMSNKRDARIEAMSSILSSTDHMASAESAYTHEGDLIEGDIVDELNKRTREAYERITDEGDKVEKQNKPFKALVKKYGQEIEGMGMTVMDGETYITMMENDPNLSDDLKILLSTMKGNMPKGMTFAFGSAKDLTEYRDLMPIKGAAKSRISKGQIDFDNNIVYVANQSAETAMHEAVHAATFQKIYSYYMNQNTLKPAAQDAVKRLEAFMNDFMNSDMTYDTPQMQEVADNAKAQIQKWKSKESKLGALAQAGALNEYMAWTLTNQNLIKLAKESRNMNVLTQLTKKVKTLMARLFGSNKGDIFSNVLFNTQLVLNDDNGYTYNVPAVVRLNQSFPSSKSRLKAVAQRFDEKVASILTRESIVDPFIYENTEFADVKGAILASNTAAAFASNGFPMDALQRQTFMSVTTAMATVMKMDSLALVRAQKLYDLVMEDLTPADFLENPEMEDPQNNAPSEWVEANKKFQTLTGGNGIFKDAQGNSSLLSSFLALNQTDEGFREVLARKAIPKAAQLDFSSMDKAVDSLGNSFVDLLSVSIKNEGAKNSNVQEALDNLTETLGAIEVDTNTLLENTVQGLAEAGDARISKFMDRNGERLGSFADKSLKGETNKLKRAAFQSMNLMSGIMSQTRGAALADAAIAFANQNKNTHVIPMKEILIEVIGMTDENKAVLRMLNIVKAKVSAQRQHYRIDLPVILNSKFKTKLTEQEHKHLFQAIGKTGIANVGSLKVSQIIDMFTDESKLLDRIKKLETEIGKHPKGAQYISKSKQLAKFNVTGIAGDNLLRNADAIARLLNTTDKIGVPKADMVKAIRELVTLYGMEGQEQVAKDTMKRLAEEDYDALSFMMLTVAAQSLAESKKENGKMLTAKLNAYHGFIPHEAQDGVKLTIADDSDHEKMIRQGFIRVKDYVGEGRSIDRTRKGYYFSTVSGKSSYLQGVMQTVQDSYFGVDPMTGRTTSGILVSGSYGGDTVGAVTKWISKRQGLGNNAENNPNESLLPIFNDKGDVIGYERSVDPEVATTLNRKENLIEMMGAWAGRQSEESMAQQFNQALVDRLHERWIEDKKTNREREYIDISASSDKVWKDTWGTIPPATKAYIAKVYGENGGFMVREDLINNALGYRNPSVGDLWTGATRVPKEWSEKFSKEISDFFGMDSFRYIVTGEKALQTAVSTAKDWIVIRSVVVPSINIASNIQQLASRGVPYRDIFKGMRKVIVEITAHIRNQKKLKLIDTEINAAGGDTNKLRKLNARREAVLDAERRLSIAPLLAAGEFSTISEGMTELDESLTNGGYVDWIKDQVEKVSKKFKVELNDTGKAIYDNALVEPNTSLYQGMSRAVQYGDFLGKAIMYQHILDTDKLSPQDAMDKVSNEFVNFNINPGRTRSYSESIGLTWFWNFKLRIMKTALAMARENPLRTMMLTTGVGMAGLDLGSPVTDNFMAVWLSDRLGYSVGWDMLWSFPSLNPWINLSS